MVRNFFTTINNISIAMIVYCNRQNLICYLYSIIYHDYELIIIFILILFFVLALTFDIDIDHIATFNLILIFIFMQYVY